MQPTAPSRTFGGTRWFRVVAWLLGGCIVAISSLATFAVVNPIGFRNTVFVPVREVTFFVKQLRPFASPRAIENFAVPKPVRVTVPKAAPDDIMVVADLYRPDSNGRLPGILLLHGSSVHGRQSGIIRLLGHEFLSRGWIALAPDARGFGETDDPASVRSVDNWGVAGDIDRSLRFLVASGADEDRLFVFGHSLGADHALEGALDDRRVRKIVLASPSIYVEGITGRWQLARFAADRGLSEVLPLDVVERIRERGSLNRLAESELREPHAASLLLVYGQDDSPAVIAHYLRIARSVAPPFELRAVSGAGHWFAVRSLFGSDTVYYRRDVYREFVDVLFEFLEADDGADASFDPQVVDGSRSLGGVAAAAQ